MTFLEWPTPISTPSQQLVKTVAASGVPEAISATPLRVEVATVIGRSAPQTDNADTVRVGSLATDALQPQDIPPGGSIQLTNTDLSQWYVDAASAGDGVVVIYDR